MSTTASRFSGRSNVPKRKPTARPRGRPPVDKQPLSRELVLKTALSLLDSQGLVGLSMRLLAERLSVSPMSLYNHFRDKAGLLDALHEAVLLDVVASRRLRLAPWKSMATAIGRTLRRGLRAHPNALMLFATRPVRTPALLQAADRFLGALLDAGFSPRSAIFLLDSIGMFTIGHALAEFGVSQVAAPERDGEDLYSERASLTEQELHHLTRVVSETRPHDYEAEFEMGLGALLDGFELQLGQRRPSSEHWRKFTQVLPGK